MTFRLIFAAAAALTASVIFFSPAYAGQKAIPGLVSASLLPGQVAADGTRTTALRLTLEPGWKTYWRSPGDAGIPPSFNWSGSDNLAAATPLWPVPEVIDSAGERTLGYHDELVLPITLAPADPTKPIVGKVAIDFGVCDNVCVPAHVELTLPEAGTEPDPVIQTALSHVPAEAETAPACHITEIEDGVRVTATLSDAIAEQAAAMELADEGVWVSSPALSRDGKTLTATADFVAPSGKPFPLDPAKLRLTLIAEGQAVEYQGCSGS